MRPNNITYLLILMLTAATLVFGCANAKPFDYHSGNEIPEGPGLFSKEKGSFTVYSDEEKKKPVATDEHNSGQAASEASSGRTGGAPVNDSSDEFRRFKAWQDEQKAYEAFQQWKKSPANAREYQEFQEWKRWKEYQQWQKEQPNTR